MLPRTQLIESYLKHHPIEVAHILERFPIDETWEQLRDFELEEQAEVVEAFSPEYAARLFQILPESQSFALIRELPSDIAADFLAVLPEDLAETLIEQLPSLHSEEISNLVSYEEDTAGSLMTTDFTAIRQDATVADAVRRIKRMAYVGRAPSYIYVVDDDDKLVGVLIMRDLVLATAQLKLRDIMITDVISVEADMDLSEVALVLQERGLLAVPVTDEGELVGVISGTQLASELQEEGFEDAQKMFGAGAGEDSNSSVFFAIRKRLPWLEVNLATAFLAAAVVGAFDSLIAEITLLAAFLPVVAGQSGNAGAQSLAVMLRSLALKEFAPNASKAVLMKESLVGLVNGLLTGLTAGAIAAIVSSNLIFGVVITLAMTVNLIIAGLAGAGIPMLMERLGQDPAQSSNIILTTVTDVLGFATFLGFTLMARPFLTNLM